VVPVRRKRARAVTNEMLPRVAKWVEAFPYPTIEDQGKKIIGWDGLQEPLSVR
jgi:hypothetical protein